MNYLNRFRSLSLKIQLVFLILIALLLTGLLCDYLYENSPKVAINISTFQRQLISKENEAESKVEELKNKHLSEERR